MARGCPGERTPGPGLDAAPSHPGGPPLNPGAAERRSPRGAKYSAGVSANPNSAGIRLWCERRGCWAGGAPQISPSDGPSLGSRLLRMAFGGFRERKCFKPAADMLFWPSAKEKNPHFQKTQFLARITGK